MTRAAGRPYLHNTPPGLAQLLGINYASFGRGGGGAGDPLVSICYPPPPKFGTKGGPVWPIVMGVPKPPGMHV